MTEPATKHHDMPDRIYYTGYKSIIASDGTFQGGSLYYRAELVVVLLKQARYYLDGVARDAYDNSIVCEIIQKIDNLLGETK